MGMVEVCLFGDTGGALAVHTPIDALVAQYKKSREDIERIAAYVAGETDVMHFFLTGAMVEHNISSISTTSLFQVEPAIRALDASYWAQVMLLTDVLECMPAGKRNEWNEQIRKHKTPPFEADSVKATVETLLSQRAQYLAERVDGLFRILSGEHVTNAPQAFGKRMIISYMLTGYGSLCSDRANYVHDLRCVIAKFMGRDAPNARITHNDLGAIHSGGRHGEWHSFDGGAFKLRLYKKGTAHMEIHPDMAWRPNSVLAWMYPLAIPPEFRQKPAKASKQHDLDLDLVSYKTLMEIREGRLNRQGNELFFSEPAKPAAASVLQYLGGVPEGRFVWAFDYDVEGVLAELQRTGVLPERKSHQYYPTPEGLAEKAAELAQIGGHDTVLEPSAGQGGIAKFLPTDRTTCVEISRLHCAVLESRGYKAECADFLIWGSGRQFDRIILNPPFSDGRATDHVRRAASMLAANGRLVAILPASYRGKNVVEGMEHEWSEVFPGEFKGSGVSVAILVLTGRRHG